jgi:ADP-heptose:LPS heptosyltransferase
VTEWPAADRVDSVLAVKFGLLGDLLLADPALAALRARYPKARLRLVADSLRQAAWLRPEAVDELHAVGIGVHRPRYRRLYDPRLWRDVLALRRQPPASVAVFLNDTLSAYQRRLFTCIAWSARAAARIGVRTPQTGYLTGGPTRDELAGRHETERGWLIAGGKGPVPLPRLPDADPEAAARVREARARAAARLVVALQPMNAKPAKQWPLPRWVELGRAVVERMGGLVVLMGSASERTALEAFRSFGERCVATFGLPISSLVAVLRESDAFVGHDSGPFHVAVAAGTPSVALVGPSDPKYARYPSPLPVRALRRCVRAAENEECPLYLSCRDARCLPSLGVDEVLAALGDLLSGSRRAR